MGPCASKKVCSVASCAHTVVVLHGDYLRAIAKPELAAAMIAFYKKVDAAVAIRHQVRRCRF